MAVKRFKTSYPGVRYKEHPKRKHGVKRDRYFSIYYRVNGKKKEEGLGWQSSGWTAEKAAGQLAKLKESHRIGEGPQTLKEKREIDNKRREKEQRNLLSFSDVFKLYEESNKNKKSWTREEQLYRLWINSVIGKVSLKNISPDIHFQRIKKNMTDAKRARRTIQYCMGVIRQVFNYARDKNLYIGDNPINKKIRKELNILKVEEGNKRVKFLSQEEVEKLLKELYRRSPDVHDIALIALHCGLRASEIFNLTWHDVDFKSGTLFLGETKSGEDQIAYMTEQVKKMLSDRKKETDSESVFIGRQGKRIKDVSDTFRRTVEDLGFNRGITDRRKKIVFHSLRHTFASWLVERGVSLYTVQKLMRHKTLNQTERYSHLSNNVEKEAIKTFEASLNEYESQKDKVVEMINQ